jgi:pentatricopeptide repeat protein
MNRARTLLAALGLAGLAGLVLASGREVSAQDPDAAPAEGDIPSFPRTALEDEVYTLYNEHKLLTARRKVEELLEQEPDSIVGHYVFGNVLREAEGSLPEAANHLGRARELYESQWPVSPVPTPGTPWLLHRDILFSMQMVAGEMEKHEYRLQMLDYYDSLYRPRLIAEHAWPLMRLGRFDEAREYAQEAIDSVDPFQRSLGRNALCALEGEASERGPRYEACLAAFEDAKERAASDPIDAPPDERTNVAVHAYNAALAAHAVLRPDEVERLAIEGTKRLEFTPANPWRVLVRLYVAQGRMDEAVAALREMQSWRARQPAWLRDQDRAETDATFATLMLVAGETETALRSADRALQRPDRRGLTSSNPEQATGAHALLRRSIARTHAEILRERATWSGTMDGYEQQLSGVGSRMRSWVDDERIISVLTDDERLYATFRMYVHGGIEPVPVWMLGDLVEVLGPGVVTVVMEKVRELEELEEFDPYYDAIEAEVALAQGDERRALDLAQSAMEGLSETERMLVGRMAAVAARAAWELDSDAQAMGFLTTAMEKDAGVIRRMGLRLPARLENRADGPAATRVFELLDRSPRLDVGGEGFLVTIEGSGQALSACIHSPDGTMLSCAEPTVPTEEPEIEGADPIPVELEDHDYAGLVAEAFHQRAFAMPVVLSNVDLASLDGTSTVNEQAVRERMQGILDDLVEDQGQ